MASLIPGYEYDIFISYRQKDNKHDGWVTEFVNNLKGELESTFKEEIRVYFDINPHDGLLETHDVDASLKDKLKCLIFIPIISRTYCDPKSFAWEHEFKEFVEQASKDQFGLKVKLLNGNVTTRVLPVQIHDLNTEDKILVEQTLGGYLRAVEFIYKEPGVNRPLTSYDDEKLNLNKTRYRNQINKVANAIDEIITGLKNNQTAPLKESSWTAEYSEEIVTREKLIGKEKPVAIKIPKWLSVIALLAFIVIAGLLAYPRIFKQDKLAKLRSSDGKISVAVMPFQNMTNDTTLNVWQDGIQNELINNLTNTEELKVRQTESIAAILQSKGLYNSTSITRTVASSLSQKLGSDVFIFGTLKKAGATIRLSAQLIDSKTEEIYKGFEIDGIIDNILHTIDSLSIMVKNFLIISKLEKEESPEFKKFVSTESPEAYRYYILGKNAYYNLSYKSSINWLNQACLIDSNFTWAMWFLSVANLDFGSKEEAKKLAVRLFRKKEKMPIREKLWVTYLYAQFFHLDEAIESLKQLQKIDDQIPMVYIGLGWTYIRLQQYDNAIHEYEKAFEVYSGWGSKPPWALYYQELGFAFHKTAQYKKEKNLYNQAELDFPDSPNLIYTEAILLLSEKDTIAANRKIERFITVCNNNSWSDVHVTSDVAEIYSEAHFLDKAEKFYRKALSLDPENPDCINHLAYFLIDNDRNITEGLNLINENLKMSHNNYEYLNTKGYGLFKQGQYKEALNVLEKSWELRKQFSYYNHDAFLHLEEAKRAVGSNL